MGGEPCHRRRREDGPQRDLAAELLADSREETGGEKRMAAELEEVIVDTHLIEPEQVSPDRGQALLELVLRLAIGGREIGPLVPGRRSGRRGGSAGLGGGPG